MPVDRPEDEVARPTAHYPRADISPEEFEVFVAELLRSAVADVDGLVVQMHEVVAGSDGDYDIDATVRFEVGGMAFLVLVEAKRHKDPIKRELVQVLHQKVQSTGAQKGTMISTAPFQSGALKFAMSHGIALATVTEGRFTFETKSASGAPDLTRGEAQQRFGLPPFVGHAYTPGREPGVISVHLIGADRPDYIASTLLGAPISPE